MVLHGAYFGVAEGSLFVLDPVAKEFSRANGEKRRMANSEWRIGKSDQHLLFPDSLLAIRNSPLAIRYSPLP